MPPVGGVSWLTLQAIRKPNNLVAIVWEGCFLHSSTEIHSPTCSRCLLKKVKDVSILLSLQNAQTLT